jgi:hypothetical protein
MGLEFLARVRRTSLWIGGVAALVAATYAAPTHGLALALGTAWSLTNLVLLERLIVALTGADRRTFGATGRAISAIGGILLLFAAGWLLLTRLSAALLMIGFAVPFAVLVLKAASLLVLPTRAWQRFARSPWLAGGTVAILFAAAWVVVGGAAAQRHDVPAAAQQVAAAPETLGHAAPEGAAVHESGAAPQAHGGGAAHEGGAEEEAGPQKFANVITVLHRAFPDQGWSRFLHHYEVIIFSLLVALLICVVAMIATRNPQMVPGPLQNAVEMVVESLHDFIVGILGPRYGRRYVPFLGTLFVYIEPQRHRGAGPHRIRLFAVHRLP